MQSACMLPVHLILLVMGAGVLLLLLLLLCAGLFCFSSGDGGWRRSYSFVTSHVSCSITEETPVLRKEIAGNPKKWQYLDDLDDMDYRSLTGSNLSRLTNGRSDSHFYSVSNEFPLPACRCRHNETNRRAPLLEFANVAKQKYICLGRVAWRR